MKIIILCNGCSCNIAFLISYDDDFSFDPLLLFKSELLKSFGKATPFYRVQKCCYLLVSKQLNRSWQECSRRNELTLN